jgi:catechol 2,3-dioxygenase-like lactoylglutathione lyase family enzyme
MLRRAFFWFIVIVGTLCAAETQPLVSAVDSIGLTVSDLDRSVAFYTSVLSFEKVSGYEAAGEAYEHLTGVFGSHESRPHAYAELAEFLAPSRRRP